MQNTTGDDLEFEVGTLVKVHGMRPDYMSAAGLYELVRELGTVVLAERARADEAGRERDIAIRLVKSEGDNNRVLREALRATEARATSAEAEVARLREALAGERERAAVIAGAHGALYRRNADEAETLGQLRTAGVLAACAALANEIAADIRARTVQGVDV